MFFLLLNFLCIFAISFSRGDFFSEHFENFDSAKISLVLLVFIFVLSAYIFLFFEKKDKLDRKEMTIVVLILLIAVATPPFLSRDIGAYLVGARNFIWLHANPYTTGIDSIKDNNLWLKELGDWWSLKYPFAYGPIFLVIASFSVLPNFVHLIGAVYFYKLIVFFAYIFSIVIFSKIVKILSLNKFLVVLYAINPAMLINGLVDGHNEIFLVLFLLLTVYFLIKKAGYKSYLFWIASVLVKYNVLILMPIFWKEHNRFSIKKIIISSVGVVISFIIILGIFFKFNILSFGGNVSIMKGQLQMCFYHCSPVSSITDLLAGEFSNTLRLALFLLMYVFLFFKFIFKDNNFLKFIFWTALGLIFILTRWISPWYVLISIPIGLLIDDDKYRVAVVGLTVYSLLHFFGLF